MENGEAAHERVSAEANAVPRSNTLGPLDRAPAAMTILEKREMG